MFARIGTPIYAPVSGVIVASADDWKGSWNRRKGFQYDSGGLGELSGNGVLLFNPIHRNYFFMIHMKDGYVDAGDLVSRGETIGTVGNTGNAISPHVKSHLHFAVKAPGIACGKENVLIAQNSYNDLRQNRDTFLAKKANNQHIIATE